MSIASKLDNFFSSRDAFKKIITVLIVFSLIRAIIYGLVLSIIINVILLLALQYIAIKRFFHNSRGRIKRKKFERQKREIEAVTEPKDYGVLEDVEL